MQAIPQRKTPRLCALLAALLLTSGCYKVTFYQDPNAVRGEEHDRWSDFFILGVAGEEEFNTSEYCKATHVAEIRTGANFGTTLVGVVTLGIYTPRKFYITCAAAEPGSESP